jgi:hypothetical protein
MNAFDGELMTCFVCISGGLALTYGNQQIMKALHQHSLQVQFRMVQLVVICNKKFTEG